MKPLSEYIRSIPDFPKPGVIFRDLTTLIENPEGYRRSVDLITEAVALWGPIDKIAAPEARGFIFGAPIALRLNAGLVPVRKPGKLPYKTFGIDYELEYGTKRLEIHQDAVLPNERVVLIDDLLATGGTIAACRKLLENCGAIVVGAAFLVELVDLKDREALGDLPVFAPIKFEGE